MPGSIRARLNDTINMQCGRNLNGEDFFTYRVRFKGRASCDQDRKEIQKNKASSAHLAMRENIKKRFNEILSAEKLKTCCKTNRQGALNNIRFVYVSRYKFNSYFCACAFFTLDVDFSFHKLYKIDNKAVAKSPSLLVIRSFL